MPQDDPQTPKTRPRLTTDGKPYVPPMNVLSTSEASPIRQNGALESKPVVQKSEKPSRSPWIRAGVISVLLLGCKQFFVSPKN